MAYKIMLAGGGTGGHVYPLVAIAEELKNLAAENNISLELRFIGSGNILKTATQEAGFESVMVLAAKWRRYFSLLNLVDIFKLPIAFLQSLFKVWLFMPDAIIAKGGYASLLPALAGRFMLVPLFIHETDSIPGAANKLLAKFSRKVFVSFEDSSPFFNTDKVVVVGNPLRKDVLLDTPRSQARASFNLKDSKPVVLITGANQGAKIINEVLLLALPELVSKFQVIHQSGHAGYEEIHKKVENIIKEGRTSYGQIIKDNYRLYPAFDVKQMALAYSACDLIISRSGSQIFETAAVGKPTVLIPLANSSRNHQQANADIMAKFGAIVIREDNLKPHILLSEISQAYENRLVLSEKIKTFAKIDAAAIITRDILTYLNK